MKVSKTGEWHTEVKCLRCGRSSFERGGFFFDVKIRKGSYLVKHHLCTKCRPIMKVCKDCFILLSDEGEELIVFDKSTHLDSNGETIKIINYQCEGCYIKSQALKTIKDIEAKKVAQSAYRGL